MDLQRCLRAGLAIALAIAAAGCGSASRPARPQYTLVSVGPAGSGVRMFRSEHHLVYTTFDDDRRLAASIETLEASYGACVELTGVKPAGGENEQIAFLFSRRAEWEAFTRSRAGAAAPLYLRLDRGGYTLGKACVVRDQGEHDTLTVLAHEELHVFIATHFQARPPPFLEEGLATLLERVRSDDGRIQIDVGNSTSRAIRLTTVIDAGQLMPLRQLLSMHAGNVVGLSGQEVDAFYSQAWALARFLREGEGGRYRPALMRLLNDAATGALSSASLEEDPSLIERYLGESLESIEPAYRRFAAKVAG
jgi:hypothetical protein